MSHSKLIPAASAIALLTGCATTGYQQICLRTARWRDLCERRRGLRALLTAKHPRRITATRATKSWRLMKT